MYPCNDGQGKLEHCSNLEATLNVYFPSATEYINLCLLTFASFDTPEELSNLA